jgi:hypothetical protein
LIVPTLVGTGRRGTCGAGDLELEEYVLPGARTGEAKVPVVATTWW